MPKKVAVIHTSTVSLDDLRGLFAKIMPQVEMVNIIDESLLREVMANGKVTPSIIKRICSYAVHAEDIGADLILNQCSSVGQAVNVARSLVNIPYIKIDEAMAEEAVNTGTNISLIATVASTVEPSAGLIEEAAQNMGKKVNVKRCLVDGALDILMKEKDVKKHNRLVVDAIKKVVPESDVIVLAQGSMIGLLPELKDLGIPVLSSPESGVKRTASILKKL
jgi:Asp/Glu/hydantoin racemase